MAKNTISRSKFNEKAKALVVKIGNTPILADVKEFSTGSFGWFAGGKIVVEIDGEMVQVQVGLNLTVIGSKDAAE